MRLTFANLRNNSYSGNDLEENEENNLWIPNLIFENSVVDAYVKNDPLSSIEILKIGLPQRNSNHELFENYIYSGKTNPLIYSRTYDLKFACGFELHYFPFDHQECFILVTYF